MEKVNESIICAGFGGQGIVLLGKVLATAGMARGLHVTWIPSYGAEVRGGTAFSMVRISDTPIASPIFRNADTAIIMNDPSLEKFESKIKKGALLILNSSMVKRAVTRKDIEVISVPLTDEAIRLGNGRIANMIACGIFIAKKKIFGKEVLVKVINEMAADRKELVDINVRAVERGMELANTAHGSVRGTKKE